MSHVFEGAVPLADLFLSPVFWGVVIFIAVLAYLMGRSSVAPVAGAAPGPAAKPRTAHVDDVVSGQSSEPATHTKPSKPLSQPQTYERAAGEGAKNRPALATITSWGYQLQDLDVARAAASPFDLLVIDYTKDGSDETRLTPAELDRLKRRPDGARRIVLAYVSIGEAESYRPYWNASWKKNKPEWLLRENPEWKENYAVCFWEPGWQNLMCGSPDAYLDRVQSQGFDGLYLDKCDVFEDLAAHEKKVAATRPDIERDMVAFVQAISRNAKARDPNFLIIMQNAEGLVEHRDLLAAIDGIAKEELVFGVDGPEKKNGAEDIAYSKDCLDKVKRAGKAVLVVEYLNARDKISKAAEIVEGAGYVLYIAPKDRELKRLNYDVREA
jgi:cysteinyl-tRNA synthetase, unknown class